MLDIADGTADARLGEVVAAEQEARERANIFLEAATSRQRRIAVLHFNRRNHSPPHPWIYMHPCTQSKIKLEHVGMLGSKNWTKARAGWGYTQERNPDKPKTARAQPKDLRTEKISNAL